MRIILIWINLFSIIFTVKIGASLSTSEDQNLNNIYEDLLELNYGSSDDVTLTSTDKKRHQQSVDVNHVNMNADEKQPTIEKEEERKVLEQSTIPHQVEMMKMYGGSVSSESAESGRKRKSFPQRKKKKKRRKHRQQKKNEKHIYGNAENLTLSTSTTANAMTTESNFATKSFENKLSHSTKNENAENVVMEMVEAIIDNNESNLKEFPAKSFNFVTEEEEQLNNFKKKEEKQVESNATTTSVKMESNPLHSSDEKNSKIDKRLKRRKRRKFMIGDLSCMKAVFVPAPRVANADIKYIRNEMYGFEKSFLEAEYHCQNGYRLIKKSPKRKSMTIAASSGKNLICKKRRWLGQKPFCRQIKNPSSTVETKASTVQQCDSHEAQKCEQLCIKTGNRTASCLCHKGFRLIGTQCLDINECEEKSGICGQGKCINLIGAFKCFCQQGFQPDESGKCVDINECLLRNGHGGCQDKCVNTVGAFTCSCENLKGTKLSKDGHSCEPVEICSINNGGCSHTCHDTIGEAFCSCPEGYKLDEDWKTCIDIDECQLQDALSDDMRCNYECINTIGSFRCIDVGIGADQPVNKDFDDYVTARDGSEDYKVGSDDTDGNYDIIDGVSVVSECLNGFYFNESVGDCQDINECEIDNGNCSNGTCVNTNGSFYCSCHKGFMLSEDDRYKCIPIETEQNKKATENPLNRVIVVCPPLFPPTHGYLECTRPLENSTSSGRMKIMNRPGSECRLRCPTSYRASGTYIRTCGNDGKWHGYDDGICIKYPTPRLICPPNQLLELPENSKKVQVKLQRPKTDVNFKRDITIKPSWIKSEKITLGIGVQNITYTAKHPISKLSFACTTSIFVVDGEPPAVDYCPPSQKHKVEKHHESLKVSWIEPKFSDNVKVTDVTQTNMAGSLFGLGSHQIIYEARDAAGYKRRCIFKIVINAPKRDGLKLPIKNNKFYY